MSVAFDLLLGLYRKLDAVREGTQYVAASGSTATLVCSALTQVADYWNNGCLLITRDAGGAGAAPEKESRDISDFGSSSVTVGTVFSAAPAAGDSFAIATDQFTRSSCLRALNAALLWYGPLPWEDSSTLNTIASTTEYTLPAAAVNDLCQVWIAARTTAPLLWQPCAEWHVDPYAGKLIFAAEQAAGYDIKLIYQAPHAELTADSTAVSGLVYTEAVLEYAYAEALRMNTQDLGKDSRRFIERINDGRAMAEALKKQHRLPPVPRQPKYLSIANQDRSGVNGFTYILP